jgi:uncharacterized protein (TIGR00725 family)
VLFIARFDFKMEYKATISIIGASEIDEKTRQKTIHLGKLLARNKYAIACGGLTGVMEAICQGAKEEGGLTIGIIPFLEKKYANEFIDIVIPVPFSQARNVVVVLAGDATVAIAGKAGTLSEICFSWIYDKPIIALMNVDGWSSEMAGKKLDDRRMDHILGADTPEDVIDKLNQLVNAREFKNNDIEEKFLP